MITRRRLPAAFLFIVPAVFWLALAPAPGSCSQDCTAQVNLADPELADFKVRACSARLEEQSQDNSTSNYPFCTGHPVDC